MDRVQENDIETGVAMKRPTMPPDPLHPFADASGCSPFHRCVRGQLDAIIDDLMGGAMVAWFIFLMMRL